MEESKKRAKLNAMVRNVNFVQSFNGSNVSELSHKFAFESTFKFATFHPTEFDECE